jgi:hypothetical protein
MYKNLLNYNYEIYICIDDNSYDIPNYDNSIKIIKLNNLICEQAGFKNTVMYFRNKACSRDKALYYFCNININYNNIWFIEDDVLIPSIYTIQNIDNKYNGSDLISGETQIININDNDKKDKFIANFVKCDFINKFTIDKYLKCMICAIRVSRKMMLCIEQFANKYNSLGFDEIFFPTLALDNNLIHNKVVELNTILYRRNWKLYEIKKTNLYHPIKNPEDQYNYIKNISSNLFDKLEVDNIKYSKIYKYLLI